jgi:hypothetical protein
MSRAGAARTGQPLPEGASVGYALDHGHGRGGGDGRVERIATRAQRPTPLPEASTCGEATMPRGARDSSQRVEGMDRFYRTASLVPRV